MIRSDDDDGDVILFTRSSSLRVGVDGLAFMVMKVLF